MAYDSRQPNNLQLLFAALSGSIPFTLSGELNVWWRVGNTAQMARAVIQGEADLGFVEGRVTDRAPRG